MHAPRPATEDAELQVTEERLEEVLTNLKVILLFCFLHKQINILDTFYCNLVCAGGCCAAPLQTMWSGPIRFQNGSCSKT